MSHRESLWVIAALWWPIELHSLWAWVIAALRWPIELYSLWVWVITALHSRLNCRVLLSSGRFRLLHDGTCQCSYCSLGSPSYCRVGRASVFVTCVTICHSHVTMAVVLWHHEPLEPKFQDPWIWISACVREQSVTLQSIKHDVFLFNWIIYKVFQPEIPPWCA